MLVDVLEDDQWQMAPGERAALKGLLADVQPKLAIEIGTGSGGSLRRIARAAGHVHSFDLAEPPGELSYLQNVSFHTGDSHVLLPVVLGQLVEDGINADFVLVDGDHSAEGVRRDIEDLLASPAITDTLVVVHDTANPEVRAGLDEIDYAAYPKIVWVDLDWVPGFMFREGPAANQAWGGLGIILIDAKRGPAGDTVVAQYAHPTATLLAELRPQDASDSSGPRSVLAWMRVLPWVRGGK
jgi:hypothetical protein